MRLAPVLAAVGQVLLAFGPMMLIPAAVAVGYREYDDLWSFLAATVFTVVLGYLLRLLGNVGFDNLRRVEGAAVVSLTWLLVAACGGIPFIMAGLSPIDAMFESMSGFTTTGATVIRQFSMYGHAIFFWRSLSQWLGGLGVVVLFVAILPSLAIAGREMFFAESTGPSKEALTPHIRQTAAALYKVYLFFTILEIALLWFAGMPLFHAVCNTFATMAAGGFSPQPESIMGYHSAPIEWIIIAFMFIAGSNFALYYHAARGRFRVLWRDAEIRLYGGIVLVSTVLLALIRVTHDGAVAELDTVREAMFQNLSILTTTGFASADFATWSDASKAVLFGLMTIGGCAGSAGGGPKVVRVQILLKHSWVSLRRAVHPRAVLPVRHSGGIVSTPVLHSIVAFFLLYFLCFGLGALALIVIENDFIVGLTGAIATLGNIGPGFASIGPMGHFGDFTTVSKAICVALMWLGRLEVVTILMIFSAAVRVRR